MEEKQSNVPETENAELSPEEIVARAKRENEKLGDERQRGRMAWGNYAGFIATTLAAVIVLLVEVCVGDRLPTEIYVILFSGIAAQNIAQACVCAKKFRALYIVISVLITAGVVMFWVTWIMELCGVAL